MRRVEPSLLLRWSRWLDAAAAHVLPSTCFACRGRLARVQHLGACAACWASLAPLRGPTCERCALPLELDAASALCLRCALRPPPLDGAVAAVTYDEPARRFLIQAKERHRPELFGPLAAQLASAVEASIAVDRVDVVVPVPSSLVARLRRGFEPGRELAAELAGRLRVPLHAGVLRRRPLSGGPSKRLGAAARWHRVRTQLVARQTVSGLRVLLVDDVMTTGATAAACAVALRGAGAKEVRAAVWARTPAMRPFDLSLARRL